ncbi:hypothetical protein BCR44DRAFT_1441790 [Catenaria anguillulae PL171]|uniref:Uncharacterized protein n=1 Tax=Catenaria anguillulae PL171 TaxID=765915 RepID=A0A1Y2HDE3_9FUNG|nr:hypothetical protein BCR44DRAFT_1441790 [Catenaria anguillulae PL171]
MAQWAQPRPCWVSLLLKAACHKWTWRWARVASLWERIAQVQPQVWRVCLWAWWVHLRAWRPCVRVRVLVRAQWPLVAQGRGRARLAQGVESGWHQPQAFQ